MNVLAGNMAAPAVAQPAAVAQAQHLPGQEASLGLTHWLQQLEGGVQQEAAALLQNTTAEEDVQEAALQALSEPGDVLAPVAQELQAFPAFAPTLWAVTESAKGASGTPAALPADALAAPVAGLPPAAQGILRVVAEPLSKVQHQTGELADLDMAAAELPSAGTSVSSLQGAGVAERQAVQSTSVVALPPVAVNKGEQPLVQALAQRIQVQQVQGAEVATVRLDPPQMGSLEIRISHNAAGAVQVHMQASNAEVGRQLTTLVDSLRQELQLRTTDAQVTVAQGRGTSAGAGQGDASRQQHGHEQQETVIGQALQAWDGSALI